MQPERKRKIRNIVLFFAVCIGISALVFLILWLCGVFYFDNGIAFNAELFSSLKDSFWIYPTFIAIQVVITVLLCFVPATSATMIGVAVALFGANWKAFLTCYIGVILSSVGMDLVGRLGGEKAVVKLIGEEDYKSASRLITEKGYTYLPFMYLLPLFPDDALCFCAGVVRMNFLYHILIITLCRGIGVATIVFGISVIPYEEWLPFTEHIYDWFILLGVLIAYVMALLKISRWIDRKVTAFLEKKRMKGEKENGDK